jgi:hypothetical protein
MKRDNLLKHASVAFVFALGLYLMAFYGIERARQIKGPWHVTFKSDERGQPSITVSQPQMKVADLQLLFQGEKIQQTNLSETIIFDSPKTNIPFGKIIFFDTTFLPGTITFDLFGHEIELLPRVLGVNRKEVPWKSDTTIQLSEPEKVPPGTAPRKRK